MKKIVSFLVWISAAYGYAFANNIQVSNVTVTGKNTTSDFVLVQFDLTWENSWRITSAHQIGMRLGCLLNSGKGQGRGYMLG
jgi:hypothetical protein